MHVALSKFFISILDLDRKDFSLSNFILSNKCYFCERSCENIVLQLSSVF